MVTISDKAKAIQALVQERDNLTKEALKTTDQMVEYIRRYEYEMKMLSDYQKDLLLKMAELDEAMGKLIK